MIDVNRIEGSVEKVKTELQDLGVYNEVMLLILELKRRDLSKPDFSGIDIIPITDPRDVARRLARGIRGEEPDGDDTAGSLV